ncbi:MAG: winged helix-turn-helix transcriptional regulator [Gallionella sp.]|nr:winged helix-turn-helix transcriptional regulator [Gallionella sp.]MDD5613267.1 winged helix-turn-helix transcriptional regulator [Gallionella sp.]
MKSDDRNSAGKMLDLVEALSGCVVAGASNGALAKGLGLSPSNVTVMMRTLIDKGWARKDEATGHFHPTARMGQIFGRVLADIGEAERKVAELKHNFTRT